MSQYSTGNEFYNLILNVKGGEFFGVSFGFKAAFYRLSVIQTLNNPIYT